MRRFAYNELEVNDPVEVTEDDIRRDFWPHYKREMEKAIARGSPNVKDGDITWENCLDEFIVVNWAWELNDTETS